MKEHIGKKFEVIKQHIYETDPELAGMLFSIRLEDNTEIEAWFEEIYKDSCIIDGKVI